MKHILILITIIIIIIIFVSCTSQNSRIQELQKANPKCKVYPIDINEYIVYNDSFILHVSWASIGGGSVIKVK